MPTHLVLVVMPVVMPVARPVVMPVVTQASAAVNAMPEMIAAAVRAKVAKASEVASAA